MPTGTVDNINIQLSTDAERAIRSMDKFITTMKSLNTTFSKGVSGIRTYSKELGTMQSALNSINKIKVKAPDVSGLTKAVKSISKLDTSGASKTSNDIKNISQSLKGLSNVSFNDSGINKTVNALNRLFKADFSRFNPNDFQRIVESINALGEVKDVSPSINRLVSSLSRIANAGAKTGQSAQSIYNLASETSRAAEKLSGIGKISEDVNLFVQSIAKLASSGSKTSQTASGLSALSAETLKFFQAMQNAPKISKDTIAMTQALAQLASSGGKVGSSTNTVINSFNRLSSIGSKTLSAIKRISSGIVSAFTNIGNSSRKINNASFSLGNLLKTAIAFRVGYGLLSFGKQAIELGKNIAEVENVVDVSFGSMADKAYEFASTAKEQFGLSELAAKEYAGTMMAMLKSSGVAQDAAAEMSTTLAGLAGDLASFYNIETDEAFYKLRSAIAGETEPMRQLGVNMTVAALQSYALSQGINKSWQEMTQAEQAMLRYNYLLAVTGDQQGDYQRTIGSFANQLRLLQLNFQSLGATIGQGMIAAILPAIQALNAFMVVLQKAALAFRDFMYVLTGYEGQGSQSGIVNEFAGIGDVSTGLEDIGSAGGDAASGMDDATGAAEELKKALSVLSFDELNQLSSAADNASGSLDDIGGSGIGSGSGSGIDFGGLESATDSLKKNKVVEAVNEWARQIREAFLDHDWDKLGFVIADGLNKGLQKIYDVINWNNVGPKVTAFISAFTQTFNSFAKSFNFDLLGRTIGAGVNTIVNTLNLLFDGIDWIQLGKRFSDSINGIFDEVDWGELGRLVGNYFMTIWDTLLGVVTTLDWKLVGRSFADGFNGIFSEISLGEIGTTIGKTFAGIMDMIREFVANADWNEVANQIKEGLTNAFTAASDNGKNDGIIIGLLGVGAIAGISKVLTPIMSVISSISSFIGEGGLTGAINVLKGAIGGISVPVAIAAAAVSAIALGISDLWKTSETFRDSVSDMWKKISKSFDDAKKSIWDKGILPLWKNLEDFFSSLYSLYESSGLKSAFEEIVTFLGGTLASTISTAINSFSSAFSGIIGVLSGFVEIVTGIVDILSGVFSGDWGKAWEGAEKIVDGFVGSVSSLLSGLWGTIKAIFSPVTSFFKKIFSSAYSAVEKVWDTIGNWFEDRWKDIQKVFSPSVVESFKSWFQTAYTNVKNIWASVNQWFQDKWNAIKSVFAPVASTFKSWFQSAYTNVQNVWSSVNTWFSGKWNAVKSVFGDVTSFFRSGFQSAYDAVKNIWNGLGSFFKGIAENAFSPIKKLVNGVIKGVNWVLDKVGSKTRLSEWSGVAFAKGSNGLERDTLGVVNDQKGATYKELIVPPNGTPFIPKGRNVMLPLQKGTKILPAKPTKKLMKSMGVPHFAGGIGDILGGAWSAVKSFTGEVWDYLSNPGELVKIAINKFTSLSGIIEPWLSVAGGMVNTMLSGITSYVSNIFETAAPKVNYVPSAGVEQWRALASQALRMEGQYSPSNVNLLLFQMKTESSGNPNAINLWDSNAKRGTPSKGLMQVIDPTFRAYARPGYNKNIWDPLSNMLAAIRYTVRRYGSLANGWKGHGYKDGIGTFGISELFGTIPFLAKGGLITGPTLAFTGENFRKEAVLPLENSRSMGMIADSIIGNSSGSFGLSRNEIQQAVAEGVAMAMVGTQQTPEINLYAELKTENDEVLARAVTRGQQKIEYRQNPTAKF